MKRVIIVIILIAALGTVIKVFNKVNVEATEVLTPEEVEIVQEKPNEEIVNTELYDEIEQAKIQGEKVLKLFDTLTTDKAYIKDIIYTTDLRNIIIKVEGNECNSAEASTIQLMVGLLVSSIDMKDFRSTVIIQDMETKAIISKEIY